jgi:protein-S-isoprenylcysteine O-methyltransferase Ste14
MFLGITARHKLDVKDMNPKLIARYALRESMGIVMMGAALFWSAGELNWWSAWATLAVTFAWIAATAAVILRFNPGLLAERLGPRKGARPWDIAIMGILGILQLARYIIAGLDQRFSWTGGFPLWVQITALMACCLGYALFVWAAASNAFFSQIVRIQTERSHVVVTGGPYHYVRHPAYLGAILFELAAPILLASWWGLGISGLTILLLVLRTALEDRTLNTGLPGYADYASQVPYRLLPHIW